jgi:endonuclease-3
MFALGMPAMPVDTHVFRVAMRLGLIAERVPAGGPRAKGKQHGAKSEKTAAMTAEKAHALLEAMVPPQQYYAFHIGLIKHGRRTCTAQRPACGECVLLDLCPSAAGFLKGGWRPIAGTRRDRA